MNSLDLYRAINEIDIKLVDEANNVNQRKIVPYKKIVKIGVSAAAAVAAVRFTVTKILKIRSLILRKKIKLWGR